MDYKRVLRLHYVNGFSSRAISESTKDGKTTINEFLKRFRESEVLSWPLSDDVTNEVIERLLYQKPGNITNDVYYRGFNEEEVHRKLAKKGETLLHLWKLYNAEGEVDGKRPLSYRQYCRRYANWMGNKNVTFHIQRYPGVNTELDYAGKTLVIHNRCDPDDLTPVTIFVATLSFSDYFYIEGLTSCDIGNWIPSSNVVYMTNFDDQVLSMTFHESELDNDYLADYKAKAEYYVRQHQDNEVIAKLKSNIPLTEADVAELEHILWSEVGTKQDYELEIGSVPLGEYVRSVIGLDMTAAKAAFADYLDNTQLDSRQIYFVNQIVEYIVHNGMMKDLSVLQDSPFTDQGSVVDVFSNALPVWAGIRKAIERVNANATVA